MPAGVVLSLSGGMDSTSLLARACKEFEKDTITTIGFDYGQKHSRELRYAKEIAEFFGVRFRVISLPKIFAGAGSSLVDPEVSIEHVGDYDELQSRFGAQPTVVPNRNMNFIAQLITLALAEQRSYVWLGVHAGDAHQFHYPDCTPEFIAAMAQAALISTGDEVLVQAPFNRITKAEIVLQAYQYGAPLHITQSCYRGQRPACGTCATCLERIDAFKQVGWRDPIEYAVEIDWGASVLRTYPIFDRDGSIVHY